MGNLKGDDLGRHRGPNVGPQNNADRLRQRQQPGRNKTDHQDRGHRRGLDDRGNKRAGKDRLEPIGGQPGQQRFHPAAGYTFQGFGHLVQAI